MGKSQGKKLLIAFTCTVLIAACSSENAKEPNSQAKAIEFQASNDANSATNRDHMPMPMPGGPGTGVGPVTTTPVTGTCCAGPGAGAGTIPPAAGTGTIPPGTGTGTIPPGTGTGTIPPVAGTPSPGTGAGTTPSPGTGATQPASLPAFQYLPVLTDADGNPNDAFATYNISVDANVLVNVVTPNGSWVTPMMRYNNSQLPPVIVAKRGTQMTFNVQNNLAEDTTIHWHGFKIPAIQDGGPDQPILPGASRVYNFPILQAGAPLWFHPHAHGNTATQVYAGLAGGFVVTDDITLNLEATNQLPSGAYDIPLLVQDRTFTPDIGTGRRALIYQANPMSGALGDTVLVNGVQMPALSVATRQYRFKIFNGSNARTYDFALANGAMFKIIGTDGGLLANPVDADHVMLSAGERAEIVVDFASYNVGDSVALVSRPFAAAGPPGGLANGAGFDVMRFDVTTLSTDNVILYTALPANADIYDRLTEAQAVTNRNFVMSMGGMGPGGMQFLINGKTFDINRVDEIVTAGTTEIWTISNTSMMAHPFHAHAIQWQVLDRNNLPSTGTDLGWKDTVLVQPGETVRFIGRFDPVVNIGRYMYHCHILEHEANGMMGIFEIL